MSSLVEITPEEYDRAAFSGFKGETVPFTVANARALIWFSQLAYETHRPSTVQTVSELFGFTTIVPFIKQKTALKGSFETCGLIGERSDAVILGFAGTDPGVWQNIVTDGNALPRPGTDTHGGFQLAADAARPEIEQAVQLSRRTQKPLFITGHSLGAALAALAGLVAVAEGNAPRAVYVFGMPRTGGARFEAAYDAALGAVTYRMVHGIDIVARVPSAGFRHVGQLLQCAAGAKFDQRQSLSAVGSDDPPFSRELSGALTRNVGDILTGHILSPPGPGTFGPFFQFLPAVIRDHLQDSYWKALTP